MPAPRSNGSIGKKRKISWKLWALAVVAFVIGAIGRHNDRDYRTVQEATKPVINDAKPVATDTPTFKDGEITPDTVKAAIEAKLGTTANTDKNPPKVADVKVNDDLGDGVPKGSKIVILTLNGDDGLTDRREALWIDTFTTLKTLAPNLKIYELDIDWKLPLVDANGNDKDGVVMQLKFIRQQIDKINFDSYDYNSMPGVAKDSGFYWEHPAIRQK